MAPEPPQDPAQRAKLPGEITDTSAHAGEQMLAEYDIAFDGSA
jgi:hypothetical protein